MGRLLNPESAGLVRATSRFFLNTLDKAPFVSGADTMIDVLVADIPNAQNGFRLLFSATPFPGHAAKLEWQREEYGGNWYFSPEYKMEGWLCPALGLYFKAAPERIFVKALPLPDGVDPDRKSVV